MTTGAGVGEEKKGQICKKRGDTTTTTILLSKLMFFQVLPTLSRFMVQESGYRLTVRLVKIHFLETSSTRGPLLVEPPLTAYPMTVEETPAPAEDPLFGDDAEPEEEEKIDPTTLGPDLYQAVVKNRTEKVR